MSEEVSDDFRNAIIAMTTGMKVNPDGSYAPITSAGKIVNEKAQTPTGKDISQMTQAEILQSVINNGTQIDEEKEKEDEQILNEVITPDSVAMVMKLSEALR